MEGSDDSRNEWKELAVNYSGFTGQIVRSALNSRGNQEVIDGKNGEEAWRKYETEKPGITLLAHAGSRKSVEKTSSNFLIEGTDRLISRRSSREGNVLLLSAAPGTGKTTFGLQFLQEGFKEDQLGIAIVTDFSPDDFTSTASSLGFDWRKRVESGILKIIDCYSYMLGNEVTSKFYVKNPQDLSSVFMKLKEAWNGEKNGRLILDSASTLILVSNDIDAIQFLSSISSRLKRDGFTCLFILEGGVHDAQIVNRLRYLLDGVLDMKTEETKDELQRFFRIYSLRGCTHETRWFSFNIGKKGLVLKV